MSTRVMCTLIYYLLVICSDPVVNSNSNQRANVKRLLEKLILEEDQFDVHDILPNTVPDPASLNLESDYACPVGEVVMAPDCGKMTLFYSDIIIILRDIGHTIILVFLHVFSLMCFIFRFRGYVNLCG